MPPKSPGKHGLISTLTVLFAFFAVLNGPVQAADAQRGLMLYESSCSGCHDSVLHGSGARVATTYEEVVAQVVRWAKSVEADWTDEDVADVTEFLNSRVYRYPCPDQLCPTTNAPQYNLESRAFGSLNRHQQLFQIPSNQVSLYAH